MGDLILKYAPLWLFRRIIKTANDRILGWNPNHSYYYHPPFEELDAFGKKIDPSKTYTVVGVCGRFTSKTEVRPYETIKEAKARCISDLKRKMEDLKHGN